MLAIQKQLDRWLDDLPLKEVIPVTCGIGNIKESTKCESFLGMESVGFSIFND